MWFVIITLTLFHRLKAFALLEIVAIPMMAEEWFIKNVMNNLTTFVLSSMMCATALCERKTLLRFFLANVVCY